MNGLLWINLIAFLLVTAYAISLFVYVVKTRIEYIKLGKKVEFDGKVKERLEKIWINVFGQKKLLKDKKSGIIHVMFFTASFLSNLEQSILLSKELSQVRIYRLDHYILASPFSRKL